MECRCAENAINCHRLDLDLGCFAPITYLLSPHRITASITFLHFVRGSNEWVAFRSIRAPLLPPRPASSTVWWTKKPPASTLGPHDRRPVACRLTPEGRAAVEPFRSLGRSYIP